ncbi:MAG: hypothetical protein OEU90_10390, partial [Gammaproteobacteria bacterium]|nr:hypothetical protein [Gammaproteobacteria bacterium]
MRFKTVIMVMLAIVVCLTTLGACSSSSGGGGNNNNPGPPGTLQFAEISYDATEGTVVNILVNRSGGDSGVVSVDYATADGTAIAGADYPAMNGTFTYANQTSGNQTISIPITDDNSAEVSESFTVTLSNVSGATLGANSSVTINIIDNDSAALPITGDNAQYITVAVLDAVTSTVEIIDIFDVIGIPAIGGTSPGLAKFEAGDIFTEIENCDTGEITVTWNDADNNLVISTGDTFDFVFAMCFFADSGTTLDGPASLTNMIVTGDPFNQIAPWRLAMTLGFDNLSGTDSAGTAILDGDLDLDSSSDDNVVVNLFIAIASLTAQQSDISETLTDYVLTETLDLNAQTQVASANGTLTSTSLEG